MKNDSLSIVSHNIRFLRKAQGMTQAELGENVGKSTEMICQLENGKTSARIKTIDSIADILGNRTYQLFLPSWYPDFSQLPPEALTTIKKFSSHPPQFWKSLGDMFSYFE